VRVLPSKEDRDLKRIWERVRKTSGGTFRLKVSKKALDGRYAFVPGGVLELNSEFDDVDGIEMRIGEVYGPGDYRATLIPPKTCSLQPYTFVFTIGEKQQPSPTSSGEPRYPGGEDSSPRLSDLLQVVKAAGRGKEEGGEGSGTDSSSALVNLASRLIESTVADQAKRIDNLTSAVENLTKTMAEREKAPPPPAQDPSKALEVLSNAFKNVVEVVMPRTQQLAAPSPPPAQTGPSEFEKIMFVADRMAKLNEAKIQTGPPQPQANINETLLGHLVNIFNTEVDQLRQDRSKKQGSMVENFETIAKIVGLFRETGLSPETAREVGEILDEDGAKEEPGPFKSFLLALTPVLGEVARNLGTGFGKGITQGLGGLAPGLAETGVPPKPNTQQPTSLAQQQPEMRRDDKGPAPLKPATFPRNLKPIPMPPKAGNPAPPEPRPPVTDRAGGVQGPESNTNTMTATSFPGTPVERPASYVECIKQRNAVHPVEAPKLATMTDAEFKQFIAALQMPIPAEQVARIIIHQIPDEARQFLTLPVDESWKLAEVCLTPYQREAAQTMMPRIREVFGAMKTLLDQGS
jgi:hypothetical protein